MKFSQEQQAFIDDLIQRTYTRAYQKAETGAARATELEAQLTKAREGIRDAQLEGAAAKGGAHNSSDVAFLLRDAIKIAEDGSLHVVDTVGNGRHDTSGNPLTIEGLIADFKQKNAHFFKTAAASSGSGGGGLFAGLFK